MPCGVAVTVAGSVWRAISCTRASASPSATPGCRLKDSVTDGSWLMWLIDAGPTVWRVVTTDDSGMSWPPWPCT